ncbi:Cochaperone protein [Borealophlyctis nickersoniae]|nr:Cochaperone protein [Borealophlyctis nickersoniae]
MTLQDSTTLFAEANSAFVDEDYSRALSLYTSLIEKHPSQPEYLLKRAAAQAKLGDHKRALEDAQAAVMFGKGNADVVAKAHTRRGMALWEMGNKQEAKSAFEEAERCAPDSETVKKWLARFKKELPKTAATNSSQFTFSSSAAAPVASSTTPASIPPAAPYLPPAKIRHEWFQTDSFVTITVFIKNVDPSSVSLTFTNRAVSVTVKLPSGSDYMLELDPLAHEIIPGESKYSVLGTKVEIKCKKAVQGVKWGTLEGAEQGPVAMVAGANAADKPTYPSSAKKKLDWNALEKTVEQEKPEGEQALNALFQQIYRDANDDVRRAMMKSYVESNGTCLSTNWEEVGKKKVETSAPDGMVAKKFEI